MPHRHVTSSAALDRRRQAVSLRLAGHTYQQIADRLGYRGHTGARAAVEKALREAIREPSREVITLELLRLDALQAALWPKALACDLAAVDRVLKVMERRARLLGLDVPVEQRVRVTSETDARIEQLVAELTGEEPVEGVSDVDM